MDARLELAVACVAETWEDVALLLQLQVTAMSGHAAYHKGMQSMYVLTSVKASSIAPKNTCTSGWFANKSWSPVHHKEQTTRQTNREQNAVP